MYKVSVWNSLVSGNREWCELWNKILTLLKDFKFKVPKSSERLRERDEQSGRDLLIKQSTFRGKSQSLGHLFSISDLNHSSINESEQESQL